MTPLSDPELEILLKDLESDLVERKQSWSGDVPRKARQAICAFANDLPNHRKPGVLIVGAKDDGSPANLSITDELMQMLADIKTDGKILPPPLLTVQKRTLSHTEMAIVTVWPALAPPVRHEGQIWIRIGSRRAIATAQEEAILNERRRHRDLPSDIQPLPACPMAELSQLVFETEYLPHAIAPEALAANERSLHQRLASCRMIFSVDDPMPAVLGVLTIGNSPRTWVSSDYI